MISLAFVVALVVMLNMWTCQKQGALVSFQRRDRLGFGILLKVQSFKTCYRYVKFYLYCVLFSGFKHLAHGLVYLRYEFQSKKTFAILPKPPFYACRWFI